VLLSVAVAEHYQVDWHQVVNLLELQQLGHCHARGLQAKFEYWQSEGEDLDRRLEADRVLQQREEAVVRHCPGLRGHDLRPPPEYFLVVGDRMEYSPEADHALFRRRLVEDL
jgi:hypothetical protein